MLSLLCPRCGGVMTRFPRCSCGSSVPCVGGVYQFTRQTSAHLTGPGPHYLGYGCWGRASGIPAYYTACSAKLVQLVGREEWCVDVGTGYGQVPLQIAAAGGRTVAVDISPTVLRELRRQSVAAGAAERILCARMDAYHLALASESVAVVLLNSIFPMLDTPDLALREAARVLRPDGYMVVYGQRTVEPWEPGPCEQAEQELFSAFERCLARSGWGKIWFGETEKKLTSPHFRAPVCVPAGPPAMCTFRLGDKLRRLEENGFNRYQHIPQTVYRRAWREAWAQVQAQYGSDCGNLASCRLEEPVLYLYRKGEGRL